MRHHQQRALFFLFFFFSNFSLPGKRRRQRPLAGSGRARESSRRAAPRERGEGSREPPVPTRRPRWSPAGHGSQPCRELVPAVFVRPEGGRTGSEVPRSGRQLSGATGRTLRSPRYRPLPAAARGGWRGSVSSAGTKLAALCQSGGTGTRTVTGLFSSVPDISSKPGAVRGDPRGVPQPGPALLCWDHRGGFQPRFCPAACNRLWCEGGQAKCSPPLHRVLPWKGKDDCLLSSTGLCLTFPLQNCPSVEQDQDPAVSAEYLSPK